MATRACDGIISLSHRVMAPRIDAAELLASHGPTPSCMLHAITVGSGIDAFSLQIDVTQTLKSRSIGNMRPWSVCRATRRSNNDAFLPCSRALALVHGDVSALCIRTI